jgi:hypothetical protein
MGIVEVAKTSHGGYNPWFRRAVCEQHKYGSVRGALRDGGSYSISAECRVGLSRAA